jgi:hypothetical protein
VADPLFNVKCSTAEETEGLRKVIGMPHGKDKLGTLGLLLLGASALGFVAGYVVEKASDGK